ncbi:MAG: TIGR02281 family clan AA aspartic protease [Porticoccaceae bacterium]
MPNTSPPGKKLGKGMLVASWLGIMALLTYHFSGVEEDRHNPNRALSSNVGDGFTEIVLKRNALGHYVATGQINGETVTFLLDTGATMVAVPYHLGDKLGLEKGRAVPIKTANGTSTSYITTIDELRLGDIVATQVHGGLAVGLTGNEILLGMSFLSDLEIIQRGDSLIIRQYH